METKGEWIECIDIHGVKSYRGYTLPVCIIEWIKSGTKRKCEMVNLKYEIKYDVTFEIDPFFPNIIPKVRLHFKSKKKYTLVLSYMLAVTTVRTQHFPGLHEKKKKKIARKFKIWTLRDSNLCHFSNMLQPNTAEQKLFLELSEKENENAQLL